MRAAVLRYRVMAYITGVVLIILCFVGIPLQVVAGKPEVANDVGVLHGMLYIIYLVFAFLLARRLRLAPARPCWCCWPAPSRCSRSWWNGG